MGLDEEDHSRADGAHRIGVQEGRELGHGALRTKARRQNVVGVGEPIVEGQGVREHLGEKELPSGPDVRLQDG